MTLIEGAAARHDRVAVRALQVDRCGAHHSLVKSESHLVTIIETIRMLHGHWSG